ncbi:hypothetical protein BJS_03512 [Bradyrhizobium japonicum SEMIA 5079]|nr:hypothetical protein BJS_03512 [Bradyrhizobium japonicum SEMIA 5079]
MGQVPDNFGKGCSMDIGQFDRMIGQRTVGLFSLVWRNFVLFIALSAIAFAGLLSAIFALQPKYEGLALVFASQSSTQDASGTPQKIPTKGASLVRIAESDEVIHSAIESVGMETLFDHTPTMPDSIFTRLRQHFFVGDTSPPASLDKLDAASFQLRNGLSIQAEPNSDVLRISFRDRRPLVAAAFANAIARSLIDRYLELYSSHSASEFFTRQKQRFDDQLKEAATSVNEFAERTQTYSADEQRKLLLQRQSDLLNSMASTRGLIAQKNGELKDMLDQLRKLAPVTRSPYLSSLVDSFKPDRSQGGTAQPPASSQLSAPRSGADVSDNPPLLMIQVYQQSMVNLFKINSELVGAVTLEKQQAAEAVAMTEQLNKLSDNEREFLVRRRALDQAVANSDLYSRRMVEEQINAELSAAKISPLKVLQLATVPLRPIFPKYTLAIGSAAIASLLLGFAGILLFGRKGLKPAGNKSDRNQVFNLESSEEFNLTSLDRVRDKVS